MAKIQIKTMPEDHLLDPMVVDRIEALIAELENNTCTNLSTSNLDTVYEKFYTIIDSQLKIKQVRPRDRKRNRNVEKEWWNDNLGSLAKGVRQALRVWEANNANLHLRSDYLYKQEEFSKAVRSCKRRYRRNRNNTLLQEQKKGPKKFWNFLGEKGKGSLLIQSQMQRESVSVT